MKSLLLVLFYISSLVSCNCSAGKSANLVPIGETIQKKADTPISLSAVVSKSDTKIEKTKEVITIPKKESTPTNKIESNTKIVTPNKVTPAKEKETEIVKEKEVIKPKKIIKTAPKVTSDITSPKPNHDVWNNLTKNHVTANGKVNYKAFKTDLSKVEAYLKVLEDTPPQKDWSKNEKLAYWFNLYNAATVHLVAFNYPVKSIRNISGGKPWDKKFIKSGSTIYSLNEIENTIVRPNFNEPRLHVAFNCAAVSCPNLLNEAFTASKLDNQLNFLAKQWINDTSKNNISEKKIKISKIFDWYKVDFKSGITSFINEYSNLQANPKAKISYLEYNWNLNE